MKKITVFAAALLISVSAMAGNNYKLPFVSFGIKAGYTTNQQKIDYKTLLNAESIKRNASGFNAGIVARVDFPLLPIYVQGELLYDWGKYKDVPLSGFTTNVTTNNFSVPVLVGVGIGSSNFVKIRANLGPVFNLVSTAKFSNTDNVANLENMFRKQTVTWTAGIGIDLFKIMVDVRYNGVFSKKDIAKIGDLMSVNTRPTSWTFTIGYLF
ncbi:MAG TPA: PorT family protein [Candidatus Tidjanibacter gallistercoris]|nr:PorT family protein [Candidatus Tidjanibacter gallistercoris]